MLSKSIHIAACALLAFALALPGARAADIAVGPTTLSGTLAYRERIALPPGAEAIVQLLDVSRADAPAVVVAEQRFAIERQVPIPYRLAYDPATIEARNAYSVSARIVIGERTLFASDRITPVITHERGNTANVLLKMRK